LTHGFAEQSVVCYTRCPLFHIPTDNAFRRSVSLFFGGSQGGAGAEPSHKATDYRQSSGADFVIKWGDRQRGQDCILFPVVGGAMVRQKSSQSKGFRVEI
jgi:hypothetical protein